MLRDWFGRRGRSGWWALIAGSAAIGLVLVGGVVLIEQVLYWVQERQWETITLRSFLLDERGVTTVPFVSRWLIRAGPVVHALVVQILEFVPLWAFLMVVGALIVVRMTRVE